MAVLLIGGIVAMLDSIPHAIRTVYGYNKEFCIVWPRADTENTQKMADMLHDAPQLGRMLRVRTAMMRVKTIVGQWPFIVYGLSQRDYQPMMDRLGFTITEGRLPRPGEPEMVVSRQVARNKNLHIGSVAMGPDLTDEYATVPVKVVGIMDGKHWFAFTSGRFIREQPLLRSVSLVLMADESKNQQALDIWTTKRMKGTQARVFSYEELNTQTEKDLSTLYLLLNIVIGALVVVMATMMGLLANIHFSQRMVEFGLLQAIGYTRSKLLRRVVGETLLVVIGAWIIGLGLTHLGLEIVRTQVMDPKGYPMVMAGWEIYRYTLAVPVAIGMFAVLTVWLRFRRFDPVAIVERRLV